MGYIEAHHIFPKSQYPSLIFRVTNGITLCKPCHKLVTGDELKYVGFFKKLLILRKKKRKESK
jgi:5-methylcytosine-specific restriction endonuclease McrA